MGREVKRVPAGFDWLLKQARALETGEVEWVKRAPKIEEWA